jgi:hypothetical protein
MLRRISKERRRATSEPQVSRPLNFLDSFGDTVKSRITARRFVLTDSPTTKKPIDLSFDPGFLRKQHRVRSICNASVTGWVTLVLGFVNYSDPGRHVVAAVSQWVKIDPYLAYLILTSSLMTFPALFAWIVLERYEDRSSRTAAEEHKAKIQRYLDEPDPAVQEAALGPYTA